MLDKDKVVKPVRDGWLDRECLRRPTVQNHRVMITAPPKHPELTIPSGTAGLIVNALRRDLPRIIAI